jgi:hypothetical protein
MNTDKSKPRIYHEAHEEIEVKQGQNFLFTMKDMKFMKKSIYLWKIDSNILKDTWFSRLWAIIDLNIVSGFV